MGLLDFLKQKQVPQYQDEALEYQISKVGTLQIPDRLTDINAFTLANTVSELYFPIDFIADRASKLRFYIADKNGVEVENSDLNRFIRDINPLYSFSELFYQAVFSYFSDGNIFMYVTVPSSYKNTSVNNISRCDILQPVNVSLQEYTNVSTLTATRLNDFIRTAKYNDRTGFQNDLNVDRLRIYNYDMTRKEGSLILSKPPLFKAYRSVNNLLACYSARYNVYVNNGAAGYLVKKSSATDMSAAFDDRDKILNDINDRNGLTGNRRLWGVSSVPLEWVNTLVTIKDLMPFEETLEDSIKIAAVLQIPSVLVPRKDQSTFNNQADAERSVWENTLMSAVDTVSNYFTRSFAMDKVGYKIAADYSSVSVLKANETAIEDNISKKIKNLTDLRNLSPDVNIEKEIDKILLSYEQR
jgi:hypothetical protein